MLTSEIKSKIDSARNILVGKIPTPTGQVEQITLALVYKFMNDIDEQNMELGGELKFFTGEYSKYAWKHLLDKSLSAYERVTTYGEGLEKMYLNPNLPQFFRNVFRGAFLPFRDPEVLTIFLKQIDEFKYGVNGDLGDAFEYLLQIMGTQGDAGQFLTPRHIINFIVSIVDPQKTDKILDPAEGTAGFLISSYLHILKQNTKPDSDLPGSALTYDERKKLSENFVGYDISHDMVRLSLVNLYLHGFADPRIYEYDTLGNVDRWDDDFDCIVTNPPFMTPKGGVKPHKKFSIQAKRSEVLFVDYIMEHLNPNGKAGIIVPEGIIFQSAIAYKALRKMMIDQKFLYAVVSLPSGIFQPYSGVKTSILLMDRVLAKKTKDILFVKIENDGFDLGAQRRPIDKNDLPQATYILQRYKMSIQTGKPFELSEEDKRLASLIPIEKISKSGDYNLSGDRYRETLSIVNQKWPMVELNTICRQITDGSHFSPKTTETGYPYITVKDIENDAINFSDAKFIDHNDYELLVKNGCNPQEGDVLFSKDGTIGKVSLVNYKKKFVVLSSIAIIKPEKNHILPEYLKHLLKSERILNQAIGFKTGAALKRIILADIKKIEIPLPPLEVQQEIITQLDSYQKIIDGAKQVVDNYKPEIKIDPEWEMVKLGGVCEIGSSKRVFESEWENSGVPFYRAREIVKLANQGFVDNELFISEEMFQDYSKKYGAPQAGDLMVTGVGTLGICYLVKSNDRFYFKDGNIIWLKKFSRNVESRFIKYLFEDDFVKNQISANATGGTVGTYTITGANNTIIPLPPLDIQKQIVSRIEEEQQIVNANKKLIALYQGKINEKIDEVWGG